MRLSRRGGYGADDTLPSHIMLLMQSAYLGGTRRARPMLRTSIKIHEPERERPNWAAEGWSDGEIEEDKSHGVWEITGQLASPHAREKQKFKSNLHNTN